MIVIQPEDAGACTRIWLSVILQAAVDIRNQNDKISKEVKAWHESKNFLLVCDLAGICPDKATKILTKSGKLPVNLGRLKEEQTWQRRKKKSHQPTQIT